MARGKKPTDWLAIVDLDRALKNVQHDLYGDWFRDPWGWPELGWLGTRGSHLVVEKLNEDGVGAFSPIAVAKEGFGTRPAIVMDPLDRLAYQALVDAASGDLIGELRPSVFGWRLPRGNYSIGKYSDNGHEHELFRKHISRYAGHRGMAGLKTDIVSFFANIDVERVIDKVQSETKSTLVAGRLSSMLPGWDAGPTRSGLPQRSSASAVLANAFLTPLDDALLDGPERPKRKTRAAKSIWLALRRLYAELEAGGSARWMDDMWVFRMDEAELRQIQVDIEGLLRQLGLDMNIAKTEVLEGDELWQEVAQVSHSAAEDGLQSDPKDPRPLEELIADLIENPEHRSSTSFRFALRRMRDHNLYGQVEALAEVAHRAPHAADSLARLFRESGAYRDMYRWFLKYWKGGWSTTDWSVAQFGTMFPSANTRKPLAERYAAEVASPSGSLALTSLAAERLATKDPATYRAALRAAIRDSSKPLERRALSLAAVGCREEKKFLRSALSEFKENRAVLEMLEDRNFKPLKVVADFSGN